MELVLIRHGRPERVENTGGLADPVLTENGHVQANLVAKWLGDETFDAIYSSPMRRALETARPFESLTGMEATVVEGVKEIDAKSGSYIPAEELKADREAYKAWLENDMLPDDSSEFFETVSESLEEIVETNRGNKVAVFCHGGVVNAWVCHVMGIDFRMFLDVNYTSINRFKASSSGPRSIYSINEYPHLRNHPELQVH